MSSFTLTLNGNSSELSANYYPPIELDRDAEYVCGLVDFQTYMSVPNIGEGNNKFCYTAAFLCELQANDTLAPSSLIRHAKLVDIQIGEEDIVSAVVERPGENPIVRVLYRICLKIPTGSYELDDLARYLNSALEESANGGRIILTYNKNTLKCTMRSTEDILFDSKHSTIGTLLGFADGIYEGNQTHTSNFVIKITPINVIRLETNITTGAYSNDKLVRTLHEFYPLADVGYKIVEVPKNVIYLPVAVRSIHNFVVRIVDQECNLIDFRGENITLRVHIKRL